VAKFCDGIEKLDDSANSAIWELSDHFGCYAVAARVFFRVWLIFDDVNDFVWAKHSLRKQVTQESIYTIDY